MNASQGQRHHPRPPPSGQKILPPREENQAPRVVVPNQNDPDAGPIEYQYQSEELQTPPGFDSEDENPVFPQHNPDTKFGKIRLELGMEFGTMQQFKDAVRKYSIQMGREAFFLKVEPHRCRVICYNETCPWEVYCARRNQPPSYQIKTLVDEHTCPRSNRSRSVTCKWVSEELIGKIRICPNLSRFSTWPKVDNITNNNAESLNATMVGLRGKSIITMLEDIRYYLMKTMAFHKDALMAYTGKLAPIQTSRLEKEKKEGNYWEAQWVGDDDHNVFEVRRHGRTLRVNTQERTCTCRKWQLTGLPCCHGVTAIQRKNQRPEDYAHHWLTMEAYNRTYQFHINTVPSQEYWADTEGLPCLPPPYKRPMG
ncbi:hypothetical protein Ahy_A03g013362 [Arachis hypogaea]|uniref:SWIM-type domain-containing protein n=1 Tax=Arachis hypogaea TaxID=3818 RepID=A0A445DVF0_ARAHY|nr:hypothetical protein Ahy_A03g013362 [Arachis hypogaea]